jgi:hypothetical protein
MGIMAKKGIRLLPLMAAIYKQTETLVMGAVLVPET